MNRVCKAPELSDQDGREARLAYSGGEQSAPLNSPHDIVIVERSHQGGGSDTLLRQENNRCARGEEDIFDLAPRPSQLGDHPGSPSLFSLHRSVRFCEDQDLRH